MLPSELSGWQPHPGFVPPNCPPGLEYLIPLNYLSVQQQVEYLELIANVETENKYMVRNNFGQNIYYMSEDSTYCARCCFPGCRPLEVNVIAQNNQEVLRFNRQATLWLETVRVYDFDGNFIGKAVQDSRGCETKFSVYDGSGSRIFYITGPCMPTCCQRGGVDFQLMTLDLQEEVGRITKDWRGYTAELFTDADNFGIFFPIDLDVRMKAVLLGACFMIDMAYYEKSGGNEQSRH